MKEKEKGSLFSACYKCKKRSSCTVDCKCGHRYCLVHRLPEDHNCDFDHKSFGCIQLAAENPPVVAEKIRKL
jgi:predicted nucleic acid binding AN1-type Zn finger protein